MLTNLTLFILAFLIMSAVFYASIEEEKTQKILLKVLVVFSILFFVLGATCAVVNPIDLTFRSNQMYGQN